MMFNKYKLHPVSAVINFLKGLKELIFPFIILLVANGFNVSENRNDFWEYVPLLIFLVILIIYLAAGIIKWWTFVYWFEDNELRVEYGLFVKKKRYIPFDRIQSFNYKEGIFHRIFGLVQVMVETAGSTDGEPEVILTAITKEAAKQVEKETRKVNNGEADESFEENLSEVQEFKLIHKMSTKDLLLLATTSNSVGVVIAGVAAAISQVAEFIPFDWIFEELAAFMQFGIVIVTFTIFVAFIFAWVLSVIITFISYYDFTVIQEKDRFIITRGLLEKKRITIPNNRVQAIKIVENPFRQMIRCATVVVESASGGFGEKDQKITLFPLISKREMYEPLQQLFPHFIFQQDQFIRPTKKARPFYYRIKLLLLIPIIILSSYFLFPLGLISIILVVPVLLLGIWQYKSDGFAICGNQLMLRYRIINRVTFIVEKKRIQALESKQSYFQKRKNISSVQVTVMSGIAGTSAKVPHLKETDINMVLSWFERSSLTKEESAK
ncbi:MAG: PH domain-containing protein [Lysinibacillus sp.]|nr:PH domain-containing protein [Lysinibacillus sp.]